MLPKQLSAANSLRFASDLREEPDARKFVLDCAPVSHVPPFGMLFVAAAIRQFIRRKSESLIPASFEWVNANNGYASHMGFWRSFGAEVGKPPGQALGSSRYLPITHLATAQVTRDAEAGSKRDYEVLDDRAAQLAEVLAQNAGDVFESTLQYSIRELFRNIVEHSEAPSIWYCSQYWPSRDLVEIAVLDEGIGILESLRKNPETMCTSESEAIIAATQRGTSAVNPMTHTPPGMWPGYGGNRGPNSGLGLYVIKLLSIKAGSLLIVSNNDAVTIRASGEDNRQTSFQGTAVRALFKPSSLGDLLPRVLECLADGETPSHLTPSLLARL